MADPTPIDTTPTATTPPAATSTPTTTSSPLIVTSDASRSQYNDNVTKMNTALSNTSAGAGQSYNYVDKSGKVQTIQANSSDDALKQIQSLGADPHSGVGEVKQPIVQNNQDGSSVTTNPDGTSTTQNTDGTSTSTTTDGLSLPTDVKKQYDDVISQANDTLQQRQNDLDAARATVANDPAATSALNSISAQYDTLIKAMQEKNKIVLGQAQSSVAAYGGLGAMSTNFMSNEMDRANQRIADLISKENDSLMKSNIAYKNGDVKALNEAQTAYDKANTNKLNAINDLSKATTQQVKNVQAQQKIDQNNLKIQNAQDISNSTKGAVGALALLKGTYGIEDPSKATKDQLVAISKAYGVNNPAMMLSQMQTAFLNQSKNQGTSKKQASTTGGKKTISEKDSEEVNNINQLFDKKDKNGVPYIDQDSVKAKNNGGKGYLTVDGFNTLINNTSLTRAKFIKQYGSYLSPDNLENYGLTKTEMDLLRHIGTTSAVNATK